MLHFPDYCKDIDISSLPTLLICIADDIQSSTPDKPGLQVKTFVLKHLVKVRDRSWSWLQLALKLKIMLKTLLLFLNY